MVDNFKELKDSDNKLETSSNKKNCKKVQSIMHMLKILN